MSSPVHVCVILTWQFRQTYYTCKVRVRWWIDMPFGIRVSHDGILVWPWKAQVCWRKQHMMLLLPKVVIWLWPDKTLPKTKRIIEHRKTKNKKKHDLPTTSQPPVFSASKLFSLIGVSSTSFAVWEASPWKPRSSTALLAVPGNPQRLLLCGGLAPAAEVCWGHSWQLENGGWAVVSAWRCGDVVFFLEKEHFLGLSSLYSPWTRKSKVNSLQINGAPDVMAGPKHPIENTVQNGQLCGFKMWVSKFETHQGLQWFDLFPNRTHWQFFRPGNHGTNKSVDSYQSQGVFFFFSSFQFPRFWTTQMCSES